MLEQLQFRLGSVTTIAGNLIYLVLIYFLWKSIFAFAGTDVVSGMTFLPTFLVMYFLTDGTIHLGVNLLFYLVSVPLALTINFCIDFFIGTVCLYTQSIWGINIMKEVIVLGIQLFWALVMLLVNDLFWRRSMRV